MQTYLADIKLYDFFCYFGEEKQNKENNEVSKYKRQKKLLSDNDSLQYYPNDATNPFIFIQSSTVQMGPTVTDHKT